MEAATLLRNGAIKVPLEQKVQNKKVSLPANEIITKDYSPDLMVNFNMKQFLRKSQKNIDYVPPKIKNADFQKYAKQFHVTDFLGYNYAQQFDQMVYFRYNNEQFNQLRQKDAEKGTSFFSGLFIPLKALQSKQFKIQDNIFESLNISAPQIKDSITQSFGKNCKGCSWDPLFSSNFTSGNLMAVIRKKPYQYDLILQNDINTKAVEWFNFAVKFIEDGNYTFNIVNLSNENTLCQMGMRIPHYSFLQQSFKTESVEAIKSGNGWSFGGRNVKFSKSDIRKQSQHFQQTYYTLSFEFKCKSKQQIVVFASSAPYTEVDYERFLNRVIYGKVGLRMKMDKMQLCKSLAGASLQAYVFYHRKSKSNTVLLKNMSQSKLVQRTNTNEKRKTFNINSSVNLTLLDSPTSMQNSSSLAANTTKTIVFMARQHSGQTPSSFVMQGIIQFLINNSQFDLFKKNLQFIVIPFVNPDGVKYGNQRTNLAGADLNKVWKNPNQFFQPQVYHIKKFLKSINQTHSISMLINLQSNSHSFSTYFTSSPAKKQCQLPVQIFPYICSKRIPQVSFKKSQLNSLNRQSLVDDLSETFPKALVYSFSTSNFGWKSQNLGSKKHTQLNSSHDEQMSINQFTPEIYRNVGRELISTYLQYVRLCDKNIGIRERWITQIQALPQSFNTFNQEFYLCQKKYQETWIRQLIRHDYSLYLPPPCKLQYQRNERIKHRTIVQYRSNGSLLNQLRSKSKKLTMPNVNNSYGNNSYVNSSGLTKGQKQNAGSIGNSLQFISHLPDTLTVSNNYSYDQVLGQFKKFPLSSPIFTPKRRNQILQQISESKKQSLLDRGSSLNVLKSNPPSTNFQTIMQMKQKKLSKRFIEHRGQYKPKSTKNLQPINNKLLVEGTNVNSPKSRKFITIAGIDTESFTNSN